MLRITTHVNNFKCSGVLMCVYERHVNVLVGVLIGDQPDIPAQPEAAAPSDDILTEEEESAHGFLLAPLIEGTVALLPALMRGETMRA